MPKTARHLRTTAPTDTRVAANHTVTTDCGPAAFRKNHFEKEHPEFKKFKGMMEYLDYHKFVQKEYSERVAALSKPKAGDKFTHDGLREELLSKENPESYDFIKGVVEAGTYVGSILGLAIFAPQISHELIHPVMRFFHLEKKDRDEKNS